jgi:hypothetical protein
VGFSVEITKKTKQMVNDQRDIFIYDLKVVHHLIGMRGGIDNLGFEGHIKGSLLVYGSPRQ